MKMKLFFYSTMLFVWPAAQLNGVSVSIALVRQSQVTHAPAIKIEKNNKSVFLHQDDLTYIEAELLEDSPTESTFQLTVATKDENGAFRVRGLPKITAFYSQGLGLTSMHCQGTNETFVLMLSACR